MVYQTINWSFDAVLLAGQWDFSEIVSNELTHVEVQSGVTLIFNRSIKSLVNGE